MSGGIDVPAFTEDEIAAIQVWQAEQDAAAAQAAIQAQAAAATEAARVAALRVWEWAPDYSSAIYRELWPDLIWKAADSDNPQGWYTPPRCDYGSEGYGCVGGTLAELGNPEGSGDKPGVARTYYTLHDAGLWNLTDANSHTWDYLRSRAGRNALDPRQDSQAFAMAVSAVISEMPAGGKWDFEPIKANVRTVLDGLNPQFIEAMASAMADFYNRYWSVEQSHGFFGDFFRGVFSFVGTVLSIPPIRAALAVASFGGTEAVTAGAEIGAELLAEEAGSELSIQFLPEAIELAAPEIALEVAAPEIAVEVAAPEIAAEAAPALESTQMLDLDFMDFGEVDFGADFSADFAGVDFSAEEIGFEQASDFMPPQPEGFVDNWDLLPDDTVAFQEPEVLDMPLPDAGPDFSLSDGLRALQQGSSVVRSLLPMFQDGAAAAAASAAAARAASAAGTTRTQLPALPGGGRTVTLPAGANVVAPSAGTSNLLKYGLLALSAIAALKGVG